MMKKFFKKLIWPAIVVSVLLMARQAFATDFIWTSYFKVGNPITLPATQFVSGWVTSGAYTSGGTMLMQIGQSGSIYAHIPLLDGAGNAFMTGWGVSGVYLPLTDSWVYYTTNPLWFISGWQVPANETDPVFLGASGGFVLWTAVDTGITAPWIDTLVVSQKGIVDYIEWITADLWDIMTTGAIVYSATGTVASGDLRTSLSGNTISFDYYTSARWQVNYFGALWFYGPMFDTAGNAYSTWSATFEWTTWVIALFNWGSFTGSDVQLGTSVTGVYFDPATNNFYVGYNWANWRDYTATNSVVLGSNNDTAGDYDAVVGGRDNQITSANEFNTIIWGDGSQIAGSTKYAIIAWGQDNEVSAAWYWGIFWGILNVNDRGLNASIVWGQSNYIADSYGAILWWKNNVAGNGGQLWSYAIIIWGIGNDIGRAWADTYGRAIINGYHSTIIDGVNDNVLIWRNIIGAVNDVFVYNNTGGLTTDTAGEFIVNAYGGMSVLWWITDRDWNSYINETDVVDTMTAPWTSWEVVTSKAVANYIDTYTTATGEITASAYIMTGGFIPFQFAYSWDSVEAQFFTGGAWVTSAVYTLP